MHRALEKRRTERAERLALAGKFAEEARKNLGPVTVWVYGSVARGDFSFGSDVDVFLVAPELPHHPLARLELLFRWAPPGVEPRGLTLAEFREALGKRDAQILCALRDRVLLRDALGLEPALSQAVREFP